MSRLKKGFSALSKGISNNITLLLLLLSLLSGILIGALYVNSLNISDELKSLLDIYILSHKETSFTELFLRALCSVLPFYISAICLSFYSFGTVIQIFIPFIFSLGYGVLFGHILDIYAFNGLLYLLIVLSIPFTLTAIFIIFSVKEASRISNLQFEFIKSNGAGTFEINMREEMKLNIFRQFFFLIFLTASALLKSVFLISFRSIIKL